MSIWSSNRIICYDYDMSKVTLIQVVYNSINFIPKVFPCALNQSFKDTNFVVVIAGNNDLSKEYIQENFPDVTIIDPGYNIGFSGGHNFLFETLDSEFFQLINPDLVVTPTFVEEMLKPFADPKVAAVSGKILHYNFKENKPTNIIDTTGVVISKSGSGRDRGQHEVDVGQYDSDRNLIAASGAAVMYRKSALEDAKYLRSDGSIEYFDKEFHSYWEDVDLGWRLVNRGWKIIYNPNAIAYHGRAAASSPGGYKKLYTFIKHHRSIREDIRRLNYKNHIFLYIKNSPRFYWQFFAREIAYNIFVLFFEISTFKVLPELFRQIGSIWEKRKYIRSKRKISEEDLVKLFK